TLSEASVALLIAEGRLARHREATQTWIWSCKPATSRQRGHVRGEMAGGCRPAAGQGLGLHDVIDLIPDAADRAMALAAARRFRRKAEQVAKGGEKWDRDLRRAFSKAERTALVDLLVHECAALSSEAQRSDAHGEDLPFDGPVFARLLMRLATAYGLLRAAGRDAI
ncbi:MAG: hypothetical protein GVY06_00490, partial [Alphaproteobacteria bacterium]|nr:hypothetical protein [Alphaproteobacteria bacterium]